MIHKKLKVWMATCILGIAAVGSTGCGSATYQLPINNFHNATAVVIQGTESYLTALNKTERDNYFYLQVSSGAEIHADQTERVEDFSSESIALRMKALDQLSKYGDLLYELANTGSSASIEAKASDLKTSLDNLGSQVSSLTGSKDTKFVASVNAAVPILGQVLQEVLNDRIRQAITAAVRHGTSPVNNLIDAIQTDLEVAYDGRRALASAKLAEAYREYNLEADKGSKADPAKLRTLADAISNLADAAEVLQTARPGVGLDALKAANNALASYANSKPTKTTYADLVQAMQSFADVAKSFGQAIQSLRS